MSIAILTVPLNYNYGGYLQLYALSTVVRSLSGREVVMLNRQMPPPSAAYRLRYTARMIVKRILGRSRDPLTYAAGIQHKRAALEQFAATHMPGLTQPLTSSAQMTRALTDHDVRLVIIGSDQVWRPCYVPDIEDYYGRFAHRVKVPAVTYAASFGSSEPGYTDIHREACRTYYRQLKAVSVREAGSDKVLDALGFEPREVVHVADPTLLLDTEHYRNLMYESERDNVYGDCGFCYTLDFVGETHAMIDYLKTRLAGGLHVSCPISGSSNLDYHERPTMEVWLRRIYDAPFVLTDSFHGTAMSIVMHRPFAVINNNTRGSLRFESLLRTFGLEDRLVHDTESLERAMSTSIDWDSVDACLARRRDVSMRYLRRCLSYAEPKN